MSRSGYNDDCGGWELIRWRGAVASAIRGHRGQQFLRELAAAMDAMPEQRLGAHSLQTAEGEYCTLGVVGAARGITMTSVDDWDRLDVADALSIAPALAAEIMHMNDEAGPWHGETPEQRWQRMREWVGEQIHADGQGESNG